MSNSEKLITIKVLKGMLKIAKLAMPDTYYTTDSRVKAAKGLIRDFSKRS